MYRLAPAAFIAALLAGCAQTGHHAAMPPAAPQPAPLPAPMPVSPPAALAAAAPSHVEVVMYTDPTTGRMDGPFDKATGMRVLTQMGEDGVMRVVLDAHSLTPVLLHEQQAPVAVAPAMHHPAAQRGARM